MNNIKSKLQQTLDELQDSLEREKRARADIDKTRRKVEGELKVTQETVSDLERAKKEAENTIARKEKDLSGLSSKLRLSLTSCPRVTRSPLTLRLSRMSSRGSPTMSRSSRVTPRLSATSTPTMSSTGLSTGPASRSSTPGWLVLR